MTTRDARMPTAAYVGYAETADSELADTPDVRALTQFLRSDRDLPHPDQALSLSTGVMAYFEQPEHMLYFGHAIGGRMRRSDFPLAPLRVGVHVAVMASPVRPGEPSLSTRTVEQVARLAAAAAPRQVLASREFHTLITRILRVDGEHFRSITPDSAGAPVSHMFEILPAGSDGGGNLSLTAEYLGALELALAQEIGPMARILVRQARDHSFDRADLVRRVAPAIPDAARRDAFAVRFSGPDR